MFSGQLDVRCIQQREKKTTAGTRWLPPAEKQKLGGKGWKRRAELYTVLLVIQVELGGGSWMYSQRVVRPRSGVLARDANVRIHEARSCHLK
jgi:hypothetical protein